MDKVIATSLLTIAAIVAAIMVVNAVIPTIGKSSGAMLSASDQASQIIKTDVEIIHVVGDSSQNLVYVWLKNVGKTDIRAISLSDVFWKTASSYDRLPHGSGTKYWDYVIEGDTVWRPAVTIKATLHLSSLPAGDYTVKFVTEIGVAAEKKFSI